MDVPNKLGASASVYVIILQRTNSRAEVSSLIFSLAHHLIESPIPTTFWHAENLGLISHFVFPDVANQNLVCYDDKAIDESWLDSSW